MTSEKVCEFYIVIDLSVSMSPYLQALETTVRSMINSFIDDPFTSGYCRVSLIGFGTNAKTMIPLCDLGKLETIPSFQTMEGTSYAAAFNEVFSRIQGDLKELRENEISFTRPNVFFLTDGSPTDKEHEWREALGGCCA